jgi:uncharacterized protein (TIGR03435 family)
MEPASTSSRIEIMSGETAMKNHPTTIFPHTIAVRTMQIILLMLTAGSCVALKAQESNPAQAPITEAEQPMAENANPGFLVATIKPSDPASSAGWSFPTEGRHISCANASIATIIVVAYGIHIKQILGAPDWLDKDRYDINGIPDEPGEPNLKQMQQMYQKLLADRLHLIFHRETREMPIYAITVAKGGPTLKLADPSEPLNTGNSGGGGRRTLKFTSMSMTDFVLNMNFYEDRPVIDQTGLPGRYDFTLKWTYDLTKDDEPDAPPSIFTAIKEQLGLRMNAVKGPAEVFVIDHISRPSEN